MAKKRKTLTRRVADLERFANQAVDLSSREDDRMTAIEKRMDNRQNRPDTYIHRLEQVKDALWRERDALAKRVEALEQRPITVTFTADNRLNEQLDTLIMTLDAMRTPRKPLPLYRRLWNRLRDWLKAGPAPVSTYNLERPMPRGRVPNREGK